MEIQNTRPTHKPSLASASMRQRLLSFSVQQFPPSLYKACSDHTKAYKCFANNLQTDHRNQALSISAVLKDCFKQSNARWQSSDH
ncbi:hypothetical protein PROFUN_16525 [Planoprotostelium fungivorum]|uniref:Uncharacterized protein n=1 Tax=Planoprotostelium fungivorum TaxID=1890364 RepID=A0A2P6MQ15_9EUKA|nr:hypothetical protein PROFUN_16525 [Planoprotostelium fungivorum]